LPIVECDLEPAIGTNLDATHETGDTLLIGRFFDTTGLNELPLVQPEIADGSRVLGSRRRLHWGVSARGGAS